MMNRLHLYLVLSWLGPVDYVKAQWILDNRCRRRRSLDSSVTRTKNEVVAIGQPQPQQQQQQQDTIGYGTGSRKDVNGTQTLNFANHSEEQVFWYSNLRGYTGSSTNKNAAAKQHGRILFEEDPTSFMMRLHWEVGNCWQGEWIERQWCMTCEAGDDCVAGNKLWTQFCDNSPGQKFTWIPQLGIPDSFGADGSNYGQLKLAYFDLCLERMSTNKYALQPCDPNSAYQVLVGWHPTLPFELHPIENRQKCINQHHHPRPEEEIANTSCETAAQFHTNLWKVYQNDNAGNEIVRLRRPQCSEESPCGLCEGDCDSSLECEGGLICVQRTRDDAQMPVPGCNGIPNVNADYCASPEDLFTPAIPNHSLRLREPSCTAANPCRNPCEGDCDGDDSCFGSMKCFMRGKNSPNEMVPNCAGDGIPEADYCYQPDETLALTVQYHLQEQPIDCTENKPCLQCQGDCDNNSECYGPLECFQRRQENPLAPVPGCLGDGVNGKSNKGASQYKTGVGKAKNMKTHTERLAEADYCYLPEGVFLPTETPNTEATDIATPAWQQDDDLPNANVDTLPNQPSTTLDSPKPLDNEIKKCSMNVPCEECSGDCDGDAGCAGSLVCFQRPWHRPYLKVPGCLGRGVAGADYCVQP